MKKTSKIVLAVIVVVMLGIGISTFFKVNGSIGSDKIQLRLAHGQAGDSEIGGTIAYLSDLVAEDDSMNMEVSIYPSGVLGSETAMVELVQAGVLDMAKISANTLGQFDDRYTIFSLPYLFTTTMQWQTVRSFVSCSTPRRMQAISRSDIIAMVRATSI